MLANAITSAPWYVPGEKQPSYQQLAEQASAWLLCGYWSDDRHIQNWLELQLRDDPGQACLTFQAIHDRCERALVARAAALEKRH